MTAGQRGDATQAAALTEGLKPTWLLADGAYDSDKLRKAAAAAGTTVCVKPHPMRWKRPPFDRRRYRNRNVVERFFRRIKEFRRVATRYEKKAANFLGMAWIAAFAVNADVHTR